MGTRSHGQAKSPSESSATPPQTTLQPHSFNQPAPAESVPTLEDLHIQLEQAQRGGHHLSNFAAAQPEPPPPNIQTKLAIGAPGDKYEQEADRVAQQVVQQIKVPKFDRPQSGQVVQQEPIAKHHDLQLKPILQREDGQEEDELQRSMYPGERLLTTNEFQGTSRFHPEAPRKTHDLQLKPMPPAERLAKASTAASQWAAQLADTMVQTQIESLAVGDRPRSTDLQMKSLPTSIQRKAIDEEGELQMKPARSQGVVVGDASTNLESTINSARGSGQPLDLGLQRQMGQAIGADFRGVTVHTDATADRLNQSIQAKAFTTGQDIFFRGGAYNPSSRDGQELIAHELTHVVQQNGSAVQRQVNPSQETSGWSHKTENQSSTIQLGDTSYESLSKGIHPEMRSEQRIMRKIRYQEKVYASKEAGSFFKALKAKGEGAKGDDVDALTNRLKEDQIYDYKDGEIKLLDPQAPSPTTAPRDEKLLEAGDQPPTTELLEEKAKSSEAPTRDRRRRHAITEHDLKTGEKTVIRGIRGLGPIIKFNFAGSGEITWKTRKEKYIKKKKDKKPIPAATGGEQHQSGGHKYFDTTDTLSQQKTVVEYAGPQSFVGRDVGENSTSNNLGDAKNALQRYIQIYVNTCQGILDNPIPRVTVNIKGFSRGGATASVFAHWIKHEFMYKDLVDVNVVLIDPVHGGFNLAEMPSKQDVSNVYEKEREATTGATLVLPVDSGHALGFDPQHVTGYQRIVIEYGKGVKHSWGMGESEESTLTYQDKDAKEARPIKGMKFSTLPPGLFVVSSSDMKITQVTSMAKWKEIENEIIKKVSNVSEPTRLIMIQEAVAKFLKDEKEKETKVQPKVESVANGFRPRISDLQMKPLPTRVQREAMGDEDELQRASARSQGVVVGDASTDLEASINSSRGSGQPLEPNLQRQMGQAMGADFGGVTVHTDATADRLNRSIQAKAFTTGKDVFFRSGAYNPGSLEGQELIAHELTHVVQQNRNSVQRSTKLLTPSIWEHSCLSDLRMKPLFPTLQRQAIDHIVQRHPSHAEEEEVQAKFLSATSILIQRWGEVSEEIVKKEKEMTAKYGVQIGPGADVKESDKHFSMGILNSLDKALREMHIEHLQGTFLKKILPAKGFTDLASYYNYDDAAITVGSPWWLTSWIHTKLKPLGLTNWVSLMMDAINVNHNQNFQNPDFQDRRRYGYSLFGVGREHEAHEGANLLTYTVRHEMGHAIDKKIGFTENRGRLKEFGGWEQLEFKEVSQLKKFASHFLNLIRIPAEKHEIKLVPPLEHTMITLVQNLAAGNPVEALVPAAEGNCAGFKQKLPDLKLRIDKAKKAPFLLNNGGANYLEYEGRIMHLDHYGTWVSYDKGAREKAVSNYQFSSPNEWFAEAYAAYYNPDNDNGRNTLGEPIKDWFKKNLGTPPGEEKKRGELVEKDGKEGVSLRALEELKADEVAKLLNNEEVKELPSDMKV